MWHWKALSLVGVAVLNFLQEDVVTELALYCTGVSVGAGHPKCLHTSLQVLFSVFTYQCPTRLCSREGIVVFVKYWTLEVVFSICSGCGDVQICFKTKEGAQISTPENCTGTCALVLTAYAQVWWWTSEVQGAYIHYKGIYVSTVPCYKNKVLRCREQMLGRNCTWASNSQNNKWLYKNLHVLMLMHEILCLPVWWAYLCFLLLAIGLSLHYRTPVPKAKTLLSVHDSGVWLSKSTTVVRWWKKKVARVIVLQH